MKYKNKKYKRIVVLKHKDNTSVCPCCDLYNNCQSGRSTKCGAKDISEGNVGYYEERP